MGLYEHRQISHVLDNTSEAEEPFKIKIESESYATKWLNATEAQLLAIRGILGGEAQPESGESDETLALCETEGEARFWVVDEITERDGNSPRDWQESGELVGIADEEMGGIVAYCHRGQAPRILAALRLAEEARNHG